MPTHWGEEVPSDARFRHPLYIIVRRNSSCYSPINSSEFVATLARRIDDDDDDFFDLLSSLFSRFLFVADLSRISRSSINARDDRLVRTRLGSRFGKRYISWLVFPRKKKSSRVSANRKENRSRDILSRRIHLLLDRI